ncbi:hypothetical protein EON79_00630 [bacterium]|nr:MAG: hypothetical protein EON79_00630 [bacterium]
MIISRDFNEAERLVHEVHMALRAHDNERVERVNDEITDIASRLNESQLNLLNGLSADFYSLSGEEIRFVLSKLGLGETDPEYALRNAISEGNWRLVLTLLRSLELNVSEDKRAYLRAYAYERIGLHIAPEVFYRQASSLDPKNPIYPYLEFGSLSEKSPDRAVQRARDIVGHESSPAFATAQALWFLLKREFQLRGEVERGFVEGAIASLSSRLERTELREIPPQVASSIYIQLGFLHELLDQPVIALKHYRKASLLDPESQEARELLFDVAPMSFQDSDREHDSLKRAQNAFHRDLRRELSLALVA